MEALMQTLVMPGNAITWCLAGADPNDWVLLHDFEMPVEFRKSRPDTDGAPETFKLTVVGGNAVLPLTEAVQRWLYALNPGLPPEKFGHILDTWNPGAGMKLRDKRNYIAGTNLNGDFAKLPLDITFGGAVVRVIDEFTWQGGDGIAAGTAVLELAALNALNLPEHPFEYAGNEPYVHHLVTIKGSTVNPFIHNGGGRNGGRPCFTGFMKMPGTRVIVERARARRLTSLLKPNPYAPVWYW